MLVVRVEIWPGGDESRAENIGIVAIANRGYVQAEEEDEDADAPDLCTYDVELHTPRIAGKVSHTGLLHYRRRGWIRLVAHCLEVLDGSR